MSLDKPEINIMVEEARRQRKALAERNITLVEKTSACRSKISTLQGKINIAKLAHDEVLAELIEGSAIDKDVTSARGVLREAEEAIVVEKDLLDALKKASEVNGEKLQQSVGDEQREIKGSLQSEGLRNQDSAKQAVLDAMSDYMLVHLLQGKGVDGGQYELEMMATGVWRDASARYKNAACHVSALQKKG